METKLQRTEGFVKLLSKVSLFGGNFIIFVEHLHQIFIRLKIIQFVDKLIGISIPNMFGCPFIDAVLNRLRIEGWTHHLACHTVACLLKPGDLYQSWEEGAHAFEQYLLDSD